MRHCPICDTDKPEDQFDWTNRAAGKRHSYCKPCKRSYGVTWYAENAAAVRARTARNNRRRVAELQALIWKLKSVPCTDCGRRFPSYAMDFDHVTGDKAGGIGQMVSSGFPPRSDTGGDRQVRGGLRELPPDPD